MRILLFDFAALLVILTLITQIVAPLFFPKHFDLFWLFKKEKVPLEGDVKKENAGDELRNQIKRAIGLKKKTDKVVDGVRKKTKKNLNEAENLHKQVEDL